MKSRREILTEIFLSTFRLNSLLLEKGDELVAPLGLTSARWQVLGAIAMAGQAQSCPQIARAMGITRQGAQKQLDLALEAGLIAQVINPRHERSPLFELTRAGENKFRSAMELQSSWAAALARGVDEADLGTTWEVLRALVARLPETTLPLKE